MGIFAKEPAMVIGVIMTFLALAAQFGIAISNDQRVAIQDFVTSLLPLLAAIFIRPNVASPSTLREAGTSLHQVTKASDPDVQARLYIEGRDAELAPLSKD